MYSTRELMRKTIMSVWSWKFINSSMIGDEASCNPS